jgi:putative lumazine-binding protein
MTVTETATEREAIAAAVQLYVDGASKGDADKLREGFHESAWMYGAVGEQRFDMPISQMIEIVTGQPLDADGAYRARITSVEQVGDAATATLEEQGCWGNLAFTDFFNLQKIDGAWKIVNKSFVHTGGEMPAG